MTQAPDIADIQVFAGSASRKLGSAIARNLGIELGASEVIRFSEGNLFVRVLENVRGRDVFIVQGTAFPANDNFMELLFWIDALKRASADSVPAVIPYFSYAKGDKKDEPRVSIRARVCADAIEIAGADRVVTMDLHAPQIQGFFHKSVDNLYALPIVVECIRAKHLQDMIIVSPDVGFAKQARKYASALGVNIAIADKERVAHDEHATILHIIGEVKGKTAVVVDDFITTGGTLTDVSVKLLEHGAKEVYAVVTHGVLVPGSVERIDRSPIKQLIFTDTVENQPVAFSEKIEVVS